MVIEHDQVNSCSSPSLTGIVRSSMTSRQNKPYTNPPSPASSGGSKAASLLIAYVGALGGNLVASKT